MVFEWKLKLKPKPDSFWELKIPLQDVQRLNNARLIAYFPENAYDELFMRFDVSWLVFMFWRSQRITRSVAGSCHTLRSTKWNWTLDRLEILLYIATITLDILFCNVWVCVCVFFSLCCCLNRMMHVLKSYIQNVPTQRITKAYDDKLVLFFGEFLV